jgi:K+-sensing histidine kinase KdpD
MNQTLQKVAEETADRYNRRNDLRLMQHNTGDLKLDRYISETLLYELIDNAFKFSEKGSDVTISSTVEGNGYFVKIADNGHKIKAEALADIHAFKQNDRNLFEQQGLGIGLCLADTIVKKLKGQLNFSDNLPNGILVTLQLPVEI